jgi:hypothetical protein
MVTLLISIFKMIRQIKLSEYIHSILMMCCSNHHGHILLVAYSLEPSTKIVSTLCTLKGDDKPHKYNLYYAL